MTNWWIVRVLGVAAMIAGPAFADEKAKTGAMEMPKPPEQVAAAAKAMGGTWHCNGTAAESPMGPAHKYEATMSWKLSPDKYWIVGAYSEKKSKEHPMAYKFMEYRTYDTKAGKWVSAHINEMGELLTGAGTGVIIGNSTVVGNGTGVSNVGGTLQSFKNNQIAGNSVDGTPITAFPGPGGTPLQ